ncbi:response regulator [Microvirga tunisiensis]|uniref:Response regulator n=2 Tax=Pannonibacter tanglangensis TaxID=2750084 RepID=A0A7X5F1G6_9HYPH|nr:MULTISPECIES: response regulator transcription factor [unclassified Pannonibacter]NBN63385.1 response regulator [Pannonibacter sp. XCT-34]NBN77020.1 response regulator [Pannonibacter sp. XCT-53]
MRTHEHILIVEDDPEIGTLMERHLTSHGWRVSVARSGAEMEQQMATNRIDLVVLDLMLPGEDGLSICHRLRAASAIPIIIVSAKSDDFDRVIGLEVGADDYLAKPFNPRELIARIRALFRRMDLGAAMPSVQARRLSFDGWTLDCVAHTLHSPRGSVVTLTPAELALLQVFCERPGRVLSRDQLVDLTTGVGTSSTGRNIDILVSRLRSKLDPSSSGGQYIRTVRAGGYEFVAEVSAA